MLTYLLRPPIYRQSRRLPGHMVRVSEDLRRCVVFLGVQDGTPGGSGIKCLGTAFLLVYKQSKYLVTVKHVALGLGDLPFLIRLNRQDGTSTNVNVDADLIDLKWYFHETDDDVDLAVLPFQYALREAGYDCLMIPDGYIADASKIVSESIGAGDLCYTVGLFRLMAGQKRNLPVIHVGNVALMPNDERVKVQDWNDPSGRKRRSIEAYLVEAQSLQGLSGSPVFVRPAFDVDFERMFEGTDNRTMLLRTTLFLLGVWQGAWDAKPDEVLAVEQGHELRVPVGMGVVVPVTKLVELLEGEELKRLRAEWLEQVAAKQAAKPDAI